MWPRPAASRLLSVNCTWRIRSPADRSDSALPVALAWSAPIWIYKVLILAWALWLSFALIRWLPWVWKAFAREGFWHPRRGNSAETSAGAQ